jgi:hypothetical protein
MNYVLRLAVLQSTPEVSISEAQYLGAQDARTTLNAALALEETYDLLLSNFLELEQDALSTAAASVVRQNRSYEDDFDVRAQANRRVVNLLTAARLYLDHAPQRLTDCIDDPIVAREQLKEVTSEQYDAHFSYRFMEALRNHVQHSGLPIHKIQHTSKRIGVEPDNILETHVEYLSEKNFLLENKAFHKKIRAELPQSVELIQAAREYLQGLGSVHGKVRDLVRPRAARARNTVQGLINSYAAANNGQTLGLAAYKVEGNERTDRVPIFLEWDDVRLQLLNRNSTLGNLSKRVVTGRTGPSFRAG